MLAVKQAPVETLVFAADLLNAACAKVERILSDIADAPDLPTTRPQRSEIFSSAWAAVNAAYVCRNLVWTAAGGEMSRASQAWFDLSRPARSIHNQFKLLESSLSKVANVARTSSPFFSSVKFTRLRPHQTEGITLLDIVTVSAGVGPTGRRGNLPTIDGLNISTGLGSGLSPSAQD